MEKIFSGKVPKDFSFFNDNEDTYSCSLKRGIFAVSDGASESFDAKTWSKEVVKGFFYSQKIDESWVDKAVKKYNKRVNFETLSWSKQAAFSRGSFATLLGVTCESLINSVDIVSIGDSLAVLLSNEINLISSFPYSASSEFSQHPELLSTKMINNLFLTEEYIKDHKVKWPLVPGEHLLLLMTDALGAWSLKRAEVGVPVWSVLSNIRTFKELKDLVVQERRSKSMRVDDTTLIILRS